MANLLSTFNLVVCLVVCTIFVVTDARNPSDKPVNVPESMEKLGVVPDILSTAPKNIVEVKYGGNAVVQLGNVLTPAQTKQPPTEIKWPTEPNTYYTLLMTDPDAPSRKKPIRREWQHWLVGNINGNDISSGDVLSDYIGPAPPKGSGLHRYVFLVFKQQGKLTFDEKRLSSTTFDGRGNFSNKKFAAKYNLGDPIAGNLFQAENP